MDQEIIDAVNELSTLLDERADEDPGLIVLGLQDQEMICGLNRLSALLDNTDHDPKALAALCAETIGAPLVKIIEMMEFAATVTWMEYSRAA